MTMTTQAPQNMSGSVEDNVAVITIDSAAALPMDTKTAEDVDPLLVTFAQPYDAENPLDWPTSRKWLVTDVLSATGFNRIVVSTIMAPALSTIGRELNMNSTESAMSMSIYLLATAVGPLVIGPLSEVYGRSKVLHASNIWFLIWNIVCGFAQTKQVLLASRFLAGFGASAIYALGGGVLGDLWRSEERGKTMGIYLLIPVMGAAVGPIIGGFMAARVTWRWMFWSTSMFQAAMIFMSFFCFKETYGPLILQRRAARRRAETGNPGYHSRFERDSGRKSLTAVLSRAVSRPSRLLVFHPIIQLTSILSGFGYGLLYVVLSTFSNMWIFQYHESVEISGLHYIAIALGEIIGSRIGGYAMDRVYRQYQMRRGTPLPESRLLLEIPFTILSAAGLILYGWAARFDLHWVIVDVGVVIALGGAQAAGMPTMAYVIDSYQEHVSSAMAAQQFVRSLTAFLFPLFAPTMYRTLSYGWGNTLLAGLSVALAVPISIVLWKYGPGLRARSAATY